MFRQTITTLILVTFIVGLSISQPCNELAQIIETGTQNTGGLGQNFTGEIGTDGLLYFRGSSDGIRLAVWSTDGTEGGTRMIVEDESEWGNNWREVLFSETVSFIYDDDTWYKLPHGEQELIALPEFGTRRYYEVQEAADGWYYFTGQQGGGYFSLRYNPVTEEVVNLDIVHKFTSDLQTITGSEGAMYHNPTFPESAVYLKEENEVMALHEYVTSLGITAIKSQGGYIHQEFMYAAFKDSENFSDYALINMKTNELKTSPFLGNPRESIDYGDYFILISSKSVAKINKADLSAEILFDDINPWSTSAMLADNTLLLGARTGGNNPIATIDLETGEAIILPDTEVGELFRRGKFLVHQDQFYYISQFEGNQLLNLYDFDANTSIIVDTLSVQANNAPITHALESVNGKLVASMRYGVNQHELFVCDASSSLDPLSISSIDLSLSTHEDFSVRATWRSSYRRNIEMDILQRTNDLTNWEDINVLYHDNEYLSNTFIDRNPQNGINYYRIKQMDENGEEMFSKIRSARIHKENLEAVLYPNPTIADASVFIDNAYEFSSCIIVNETGQTVASLALSGSPQRFSVENLSPGMYLCRLSNNETTKVMRLVIVK